MFLDLAKTVTSCQRCGCFFVKLYNIFTVTYVYIDCCNLSIFALVTYGGIHRRYPNLGEGKGLAIMQAKVEKEREGG